MSDGLLNDRSSAAYWLHVLRHPEHREFVAAKQKRVTRGRGFRPSRLLQTDPLIRALSNGSAEREVGLASQEVERWLAIALVMRGADAFSVADALWHGPGAIARRLPDGRSYVAQVMTDAFDFALRTESVTVEPRDGGAP